MTATRRTLLAAAAALTAAVLVAAPAVSRAAGADVADLVADEATRNELRERGDAAQRRIRAPREAFDRQLAGTGRAGQLDAQGQRALANRGIAPRTEAENLKRLDMKKADTAKLANSGKKAQGARKTAKTAKNVVRGAKAARLGAAATAGAATGGAALAAFVAVEGAKKVSGIDVPVFEAGVVGTWKTASAVIKGKSTKGIWKEQGRNIAAGAKKSGSNLKTRTCKVGNIFRAKHKDKAC